MVRSDEKRCYQCGAFGWKGWMVKVDALDREYMCYGPAWVHAWCVSEFEKARKEMRQRS